MTTVVTLPTDVDTSTKAGPPKSYRDGENNIHFNAKTTTKITTSTIPTTQQSTIYVETTKRPSTRGETSLEDDVKNTTTVLFFKHNATTEKYETTTTEETLQTTSIRGGINVSDFMTPRSTFDKTTFSTQEEDTTDVVTITAFTANLTTPATTSIYYPCTKNTNCASNELCVEDRCRVICPDNIDNADSDCITGIFNNNTKT